MMLSVVLCVASSNLFAEGEETYEAPTYETPEEILPPVEEPVSTPEEGSSEVSY